MAIYECTPESMLIDDCVAELEHDSSLSPSQAEKLARKFPGRWMPGRNGLIFGFGESARPVSAAEVERIKKSALKS